MQHQRFDGETSTEGKHLMKYSMNDTSVSERRPKQEAVCKKKKKQRPKKHFASQYSSNLAAIQPILEIAGSAVTGYSRWKRWMKHVWIGFVFFHPQVICNPRQLLERNRAASVSEPNSLGKLNYYCPPFIISSESQQLLFSVKKNTHNNPKWTAIENSYNTLKRFQTLVIQPKPWTATY